MDHARQKKIEGQGKDAIFALRGCFGIQNAFQLDVSTQDGKRDKSVFSAFRPFPLSAESIHATEKHARWACQIDRCFNDLCLTQ